MGNGIVLSRMVRVPLEEIEKPRSGYVQIIAENWWAYDPKTSSVLFYKSFGRYSHPQCNPTESIARKIIGGMWAEHGFEMRLVPVAFVPLEFKGEIDCYPNLAPLLRGINGA